MRRNNEIQKAGFILIFLRLDNFWAFSITTFFIIGKIGFEICDVGLMMIVFFYHYINIIISFFNSTNFFFIETNTHTHKGEEKNSKIKTYHNFTQKS